MYLLHISIHLLDCGVHKYVWILDSRCRLFPAALCCFVFLLTLLLRY